MRASSAGFCLGTSRKSPSGFVDLSGRDARIIKRKVGTCTWCGKKVTGRRRTWCSDDCVQTYLGCNQQALRQRAYERDRGVCAECGLDVDRLMRAVVRDLAHLGFRWVLVYSRSRVWKWLGLKCPPQSRPEPWDADHIVPICEGGDPHDLENVRTLCWWCHLGVTGELHRRRARAS